MLLTLNRELSPLGITFLLQIYHEGLLLLLKWLNKVHKVKINVSPEYVLQSIMNKHLDATS